MESPWDLETEYAKHFNEKMELKFVNSLQRMIALMDEQIIEKVNEFFQKKFLTSPWAKAKEELVYLRKIYSEKDEKNFIPAVSMLAVKFFNDKKFIVANNMVINYLLKLSVYSLCHNAVTKILDFLGKNVEVMLKINLEMRELEEQEETCYSGLGLIKESLISKEKELQKIQLSEIKLQELKLRRERLQEKKLLKIELHKIELLQKQLKELLQEKMLIEKQLKELLQKN